jgi:3-oxoacyl-[acyl-carrier-protein] synthase-3
MAIMSIRKPRIAAISTCAPARLHDNLKDGSEFSEGEIKRLVNAIGVRTRRLADDTVCSSDLCVAAADQVFGKLGWARESVDALLMVTHTPDYLMPATACLIQDRLNLPDTCACFDVGLGCSGYPYGLWLASMMLGKKGFNRVLLLVGETPARLCHGSDRSVSLLFGDAGSATAIEADPSAAKEEWHFALHSDGSRAKDFIVEAGGLRNRYGTDRRDHYIKMDGAGILHFSLKRVPPLIEETIRQSGLSSQDIDYFIFHQANRLIINHLVKKLKIPAEKVPLTLDQFGNTGGVSIPLSITQGRLKRKTEEALLLLLVGYGVGLSWGSAMIDLGPEVHLGHIEL